MLHTVWLALSSLVFVGAEQSSTLDEPVTSAKERARSDTHEASREEGRFQYFVENRGQWPERVRFLCQASGTVAWVEERAITLQLLDPSGDRLGSPGGVLVSFAFDGAAEGIVVEGLDRQRGTYNFFIGNDPSRWLTKIATFAGVRYREIQPGIDLVLRSLADGSLKYDVHVAPGADLSRLVVRCDGIEGLALEESGELRIDTALGPVAHARGLSWQELASGERREVECRERLVGERSFGFEVPDRDPILPLVIDPGIVWSTYIGSSGGVVGDSAWGVAIGPAGDVTVVGYTSGPTFPTTPGTYQNPGRGVGVESDVFVMRLSGADGSLVYSSVIGGSTNQERGLAVDVDAIGQATVAGFTFSTDFPTTPGAFDTSRDTINDAAFVLRLSPSGDQLVYSTYLEASIGNAARIDAVCVDPRTGCAIVGGRANGGYPTTAGAWNETYNGFSGGDGILTRLDATGSTLEWSTYFGGTSLDEIRGVALDDLGNVTVTGVTNSDDLPMTPGAFDTTLGTWGFSDAFVTRFDPTGSSLLWSTYLGGSGINMIDRGWGIAADPSGGVFVTGTASPNFPTTPGAFQTEPGLAGGFVTRFAADGTLLYSTHLASPVGLSEFLIDIAVDGSGMPTVGGVSDGNFPTTPGSLSATFNGGPWDSVVARLDPSLSKLVYSTYVGGVSHDGANAMSMSAEGRVAIAGVTYGLYPTTPGSHSPTYNGGQRDAFATTLDLYLQGVEPFGDPTPACRGPLLANATEMPVAGAQGFAFYCSGAPPLTDGLLALGPLRRTPARRWGVDLWIDLPVPAFLIPVTSDADGYIEVPCPLTNQVPGVVFSAQFVLQTTRSCQGSGPWCASDAVRVTVQ